MPPRFFRGRIVLGSQLLGGCVTEKREDGGMALVAAAVCPHPPLIVPEVAGDAAGQDDALREACRKAIAALQSARPDVLFVVGTGPERAAFSADDHGSFEGYGVGLTVKLGGGATGACHGQGDLPLSLTVAGWLLGQAAYRGDRQGYSVEAGISAVEAAGVGAAIAQVAPRVAVLAMGDGTICRTAKAPGSFDETAEAFDAAVVKAFAAGDAEALKNLDADEATRLGAVGRGPWQVLAGALGSASWNGHILFDQAPYGVEYLVASLSRGA